MIRKKLGMAGEDWKTMPFDEAVQVNPSVPLIRGTIYPFVDMQAVNPSSRNVAPSERRAFTGGGSRFIAGDTLMARITPCLENGKIARFVPDGDQKIGHGSTEFIIIRGRPSVTDNDFVYYLTKWDGVRQYCISQMTGSSGRQRVPTSALSHCDVTIPSLKTQRAIAHILGTLDDKIELNRKMNETLEAIARAIFKSWFIDFDPVRAKAEGREPGLPKEIADLFPDEFEDSELGEIPKGWKVKALPEVIEVNPSRSLKKGEEAPYVDMKNMPANGHRPSAWIMRPFGSGMKFVNGDTLLARITPCLENGKTAFVDFLSDGQVGWGSTEYIVFRPKPPLPDYYGYLLARDERLRDFAISNMTGSSGRQRVPANCFSKFQLAYPPKEITEVFCKMISGFQTAIKIKDEESATLAAIRDALLPKLISGEIRVKDAERIVEGAA